MSISSWVDEFYPVPANETGKEDALAATKRKWIGLRPENLGKHQVRQEAKLLVDSMGITFSVTGFTCTLCTHYYDHGKRCRECPLTKVNSGYSCDGNVVDPDRDDFGDEDERFDAYSRFTERGDPEPMINLIELAIQNEEQS